jgi:hypothetical protein
MYLVMCCITGHSHAPSPALFLSGFLWLCSQVGRSYVCVQIVWSPMRLTFPLDGVDFHWSVWTTSETESKPVTARLIGSWYLISHRVVHTSLFNIINLCTLLIHCVHIFHMISKINSDYFPKQHFAVLSLWWRRSVFCEVKAVKSKKKSKAISVTGRGGP